MIFSKSCEYAIRATVYIANQSEDCRRVGLKEIAKQIASPEAFTGKILQELVKKNIIESTKGPSGGFEIPVENHKSITLGDIVVAMDGKGLYTECGLGLKKCSSEFPCPIHGQFKEVRAQIVKILDETTLYDLSKSVEKDNTFLKL